MIFKIFFLCYLLKLKFIKIDDNIMYFIFDLNIFGEVIYIVLRVCFWDIYCNYWCILMFFLVLLILKKRILLMILINILVFNLKVNFMKFKIDLCSI